MVAVLGTTAAGVLVNDEIVGFAGSPDRVVPRGIERFEVRIIGHLRNQNAPLEFVFGDPLDVPESLFHVRTISQGPNRSGQALELFHSPRKAHLLGLLFQAPPVALPEEQKFAGQGPS